MLPPFEPLVGFFRTAPVAADEFTALTRLYLTRLQLQSTSIRSAVRRLPGIGGLSWQTVVVRDTLRNPLPHSAAGPNSLSGSCDFFYWFFFDPLSGRNLADNYRSIGQVPSIVPRHFIIPPEKVLSSVEISDQTTRIKLENVPILFDSLFHVVLCNSQFGHPVDQISLPKYRPIDWMQISIDRFLETSIESIFCRYLSSSLGRYSFDEFIALRQ